MITRRSRATEQNPVAQGAAYGNSAGRPEPLDAFGLALGRCSTPARAGC